MVYRIDSGASHFNLNMSTHTLNIVSGLTYICISTQIPFFGKLVCRARVPCTTWRI
jgi:hypothetical protein